MLTKAAALRSGRATKSGALTHFAGDIATQSVPWWLAAPAVGGMMIAISLIYIARELRRIGSQRT